ncbi:SAF domain-containing protein [Alkaliphilus pronyensis]|uniref:SAF domain-containing protein n=1 Tax=Alkaliphilus pronyensis TaxID=1482732 RepID=UPI001FA97BC6|nr:SAF domain-containing protein [Alkaliphilus pronyensis]
MDTIINTRHRGTEVLCPFVLKAGEVFTEENVRSIRPGIGLAPKYIKNVLGRAVKQELSKGTPVIWEHID